MNFSLAGEPAHTRCLDITLSQGDRGTIVFRTAAGTKLTRVSQTSEIAFEADDSDPPAGVAWSVVVKGDAETIHGRTAVFDAFEINLRPWHNSNKPFFVRLEPRSISGRRLVRPL
jgi:hypothetical protein